MKVKWRPILGTGSLAPSEEPVVFLVTSTEQWPNVIRGWRLGSPTVDLMPETDRVVGSPIDVLTPGGRAILFERRITLPDTSISTTLRDVSEGIYRMDVTTGRVDRVSFDPRPSPGQEGHLKFGGSPDGTQIAIVEGWGVTPEGHLAQAIDSRLTLTVAGLDGVPPQEICTLNAIQPLAPDTIGIQWSPNGRYLALDVCPAAPPSYSHEVTIFDTTTWQVAHRVPDAGLAGSASWGPDSDRLLVEQGPIATWVQHLDGHREPITVLPGAGARDMRPLRPAGLADNDHLLTFRQPTDRMTVMKTSLRDGHSEGLVAWTGEYYMYPVLAPMPPDTWA